MKKMEEKLRREATATVGYEYGNSEAGEVMTDSGQ